MSAAEAATVAATVRRSGSSNYSAMRLMPDDRRRAMYAIYAFCRAVDDVADGSGSPEAKSARLDDWRGEIARLHDGAPGHAITKALAPFIDRFHLARADFEAVIDGVAMDAAGPIRAPSRATLELYIDRVACAVGRLSVRVFGCPQPEGHALAGALGRALQLTNILRDLAEDAAMGRLYLPAEALLAQGIDTTDPDAVLAHPKLPLVCGEIAEEADRAFAEARHMLETCPRGSVRPARVMAAVYRALLVRLVARGWRRLNTPARVPSWLKIALALRHGLF